MDARNRIISGAVVYDYRMCVRSVEFGKGAEAGDSVPPAMPIEKDDGDLRNIGVSRL